MSRGAVSSPSTTEPRFTVSFARLDPTIPSGDDDYARSEATLADVIGRVVEEQREPRPIALWLYSRSEREVSEACDAHLRADWQASLALERFARYRLDLDTLRREELRESYGRIGYVFFDPDGEEISRVEGEDAADCRSFEKALERAWRKVFTKSRKRYVKAMEDLLDEKEEIAERRTELAEERSELVDDRNPRRKLRALEREEEEIERDLEAVLAEERETKSSLTLREEFREEES